MEPFDTQMLALRDREDDRWNEAKKRLHTRSREQLAALAEKGELALTLIEFVETLSDDRGDRDEIRDEMPITRYDYHAYAAALAEADAALLRAFNLMQLRDEEIHAEMGAE